MPRRLHAFYRTATASTLKNIPYLSVVDEAERPGNRHDLVGPEDGWGEITSTTSLGCPGGQNMQTGVLRVNGKWRV